jgi:hypothetical protein
MSKGGKAIVVTSLGLESSRSKIGKKSKTKMRAELHEGTESASEHCVGVLDS